MSRLEVEIAPAGSDLSAEWRDLTRRASPNVFMNPAALDAARATGFSRTHTLLAWDRAAGKTLVGLWALQERKVGPFGPTFLTAPPYFFAFEASPVIDPAYTSEVAAAFFDFIARAPALPKVVRVKYLDGDAAACTALQTAAHGKHSLVLSAKERPFLTRETGPKRSGSTRKKLRQEWNRLAARGTVDIVNVREAGAVREAFEVFLVLEKASWKGANGTALLSTDRDARFVRALIANLAAEGSASVALLRVDGKPIAAQVLLYCGTWAYTWKTAFDAAYEKHSPGALLIDKLAEMLFADSAIEAIESCSPDGGFMMTLWPGRRRTLDFLVDLGARPSLTFAIVALGVIGYAEAKTVGNRMRTWLGARKPRKAIAPTTPDAKHAA